MTEKEKIRITLPPEMSPEFVHEIESVLDGALIPLGFKRFGVSHEKDGRVVLKYWQFGVCT